MIVNDYIKNNNITKYQLAKKCNLPYGTLNDICNEKTDILKCSGETLLKISNATGISVDFLLKDSLRQEQTGLKRIRKIVKPIAEKYKLKSVYIFGSYARNEANENSDVDILIDRDGSDVHGIIGMNALLAEFKTALNKNIDIVTLQSLKQKSTTERNSEFVKNVLKEKVKIYG